MGWAKQVSGDLEAAPGLCRDWIMGLSCKPEQIDVPGCVFDLIDPSR